MGVVFVLVPFDVLEEGVLNGMTLNPIVFGESLKAAAHDPINILIMGRFAESDLLVEVSMNLSVLIAHVTELSKAVRNLRVQDGQFLEMLLESNRS
jgi:hypothetical protein